MEVITMKRTIIFVLLLFTSLLLISGCIDDSDVPTNPTEDEYIEYRINTLFAEVTEISLNAQNDYDDFSQGIISTNQFIENEEERISKLEEIITALKDMRAPEGYQESHNYYIQSLEYMIKSYEYHIDFIKTNNPVSDAKSKEYDELSIEYTRKMAETTP